MNDSIQILTSSSSLMLGNENSDSHCSHSIKTFNHEQFGEIRCLQGDNGEPWFVGKDVAQVLGYKNPSNALVAHVEEEDKTSYLIQVSGSNYKANTTFINESGLYALVFSSKLPQAREFKRWVTSEVLPQIRRTGATSPLPAVRRERSASTSRRCTSPETSRPRSSPANCPRRLSRLYMAS